MASLRLLLLVCLVSAASGFLTNAPLTCPTCHDAHGLVHCNNFITCHDNEVCQIKHDKGKVSSGCEHDCHGHDPDCGPGPHFPDHHHCSTCCWDQQCIDTFVTNFGGTVHGATAQNSLECPNCNHARYSTDCLVNNPDKHHVCNGDEVCSLGYNHGRLGSHCIPRQHCHDEQAHQGACGNDPFLPAVGCMECCSDMACSVAIINKLGVAGTNQQQTNSLTQPHREFACAFCAKAMHSSQCTLNQHNPDDHHICHPDQACALVHDHGSLETHCMPTQHCIDESNHEGDCGSGAVFPFGKCTTCCADSNCAETVIKKLDTDYMNHTFECPICNAGATSVADCQGTQLCRDTQVCMVLSNRRGLQFTCEATQFCVDHTRHHHACTAQSLFTGCGQCCPSTACSSSLLQQIAQQIPTTTTVVPTTSTTVTTPSTTAAPITTTTAPITTAAPTTTTAAAGAATLCPQCTNVHSYSQCVAQQKLCNPGEMCEISVKNLLFSARCATATACQNHTTPGDLDNCVKHAMYYPLDGCTRCCDTISCTFNAMQTLQHSLDQNMVPNVYCPHCSYETDHSLCMANMRQCPGATTQSQGCHLMHHEDGSFSSGCSFDLPKCQYDLESHNAGSCNISGFAPTSVCHFCCNTRTCIAQHSTQTSPYGSLSSTVPMRTAIAPTAPVTTASPPFVCKDTETKCAHYDSMFNLCTTTNTTSSTYEFVLRYCTLTCNKCTAYQASLSSQQPIIGAATTTINPPVECYTCSGRDPRRCESHYQPVTCSASNSYCINELQNHRDGTRTVVRRCGSLTECQNDWWNNSANNTQCTSFDEMFINPTQFTCTYCCDGSLCNKEVRPPSNLYHP